MDSSEHKNYSIYRRFLLFAVLAALCSWLDLVTKHQVFSHKQLFRGSEWWLWEGHIGIQKGLNEGALFGIGQGASGFFACVCVVATAAIVVWLFRFGAASDLWLTVILGCITGGILGNLYDRLGLHGLTWDGERAGERVYAVRDWLLFQWNDRFVWPNFNLADTFLVLGTIALFIHAWKSDEAADNQQEG